jgi:hypothetical protein
VVLTRDPRRADDGAVAVLVTVVVVAVVLPLMALVVDLGLTRTLSVRSRGASDAAALAAASNRPSSAGDPSTAAAIAAAKALVAANLRAPDGGWDAAWASCLDPEPLPDGTAASPGDCISFDYPVKQVRVTVPGRPVPDVFAGVIGSSAPEASATSTATWADRISPATGSCVLCVLGPYASGWNRVRVSGGDAAMTSLSLTWPGRLFVTGGGVTFGTSWTGSGSLVSPLPVRRPVPPDPFAPVLADLRRTVPYGQPSKLPPPDGDCSPGVYQTISGCTTSLASGTYYVTGNPTSTEQVSLKADAPGVLLFFTCSAPGGGTGVLAAACPSGRPPRFSGASGGSRALTAPAGTNLALVFDQGLARNEYLNSGDQLTVTGDVYGPNATLRSGGSGIALVRGRVVVGAVSGTTSTFGSTMLQVDAPPVTSAGLGNGIVRLVRSG